MAKGGKGGSDSGIIKGNRKDNILNGTDGADIIQGRGGNDILYGLAGDDRLEGEDGADQLFGGSGADTLLGGTGDDLLDGGLGDDTIDGGDGTDTAVFSGDRDSYLVTQIDANTIEITGPDGTDTFTNVEYFQFADMTQTTAEVVVPRIADVTLSSANWDVLTDTDLNGGAAVSMQISVANPGTINATEVQVITVLSIDGTLSADDIVIGSSTVSLQAGESVDFTANYAVADTLPAGQYELITYIDWSPVVAEQNTADNIVTAQIPIRFVGGTSYGTAGDDVFLATDVVETFDMGAGDDLVSFSAAGTGNGDTVLGGEGIDTARFSGRREDFDVTQVDANTVQVTGSNGTTVFTGVEQFQFSDVVQSAADVVLAPTANLAATGLSADDTTILASDAPTLSWTVSQTGVVQTGTTQNKLVIATAPNMGAVIGEQSATVTTLSNQGDTATLSAQLDASGLAPGTYFVAAVADATDSVAESDEIDNISNWTQITVEAPSYNLSLDSVVINATSDFDLNGEATVDMSITVSNTGNSDIGFFSVQLFVSEDQVGSHSDGDDWLGAGLIDGLGAGETITIDVSRTIDKQMLDGDYNLVASIQNTSSSDNDASDNQIVLIDAIPLTRTQVDGTTGNDTLTGSAADETLNGGEGDDVLVASSGADVLNGGAGVDTADFSNWAALDVRLGGESLGEPLQAFSSVDGNPQEGQVTTLLDVEKIIGTSGDDFIYTTGSTVTQIDAGAGNDTVVGTFANDSLDGGAGIDLIAGLYGDDVLSGGEGADQFFFDRESVDTGGVFGHGYDTITDFDATTDVILIVHDVFDQYDPLLDVVDTAEGALISYADDSHILVAGVTSAELDAANLVGYYEVNATF